MTTILIYAAACCDMNVPAFGARKVEESHGVSPETICQTIMNSCMTLICGHWKRVQLH